MSINQLPNFKIKKEGPISYQFLKLKITSFHEAMNFVQKLPYGRNKVRSNYMLVLEEMQGTCSTKHALLKALCIEQGYEEIKLMTGIYEMNGENTPGVGDVLKEAGLSVIPEAHCYLLYKGNRYDITRNVVSEPIEPFLVEMEIQPEQIGEYKVTVHKDYMHKWIKKNHIGLSFRELWTIRENCIKALSNNESQRD
ncbi:hypothetical protein CIB95_08750 [Lottiidibacillus patelloidae]|uniref:Uncharacterized protein n=1 Tax=Lottiidibacillus patelloidae TaxID=2670334 RepID=A0A263BSZ6_9BACI|nr:hypothetical protein [Lottiidibacillus patelloidae]OZM56851.1 hypothetical protein CIB95_08750 [Lottiidibacillus patelloidae]